MEQATAPQMRQCLAMVEVFKKTGMRFVPIPAIDDVSFEALCKQMTDKLEDLATELEKEELLP